MLSSCSTRQDIGSLLKEQPRKLVQGKIDMILIPGISIMLSQ